MQRDPGYAGVYTNGKLKNVSTAASNLFVTVVVSTLVLMTVFAFGVATVTLQSDANAASATMQASIEQLDALILDANTLLAEQQAVAAGIQQAQVHSCSKYKAFGVPGTPQGFESTLSTAISQLVDQSVAVRGGTGAVVAGMAGNDSHIYFTGTANFDTDLLWSPSVIFRATSHGKVVGAVAFLKYMTEHNMNADEPLGLYFAGYDSYNVIIPYTPTILIEAADPITTTAASQTVTFNLADPHGFTSGDLVAISGAGYPLPRADYGVQPPVLYPITNVDDIPQAEINDVHAVVVTGPNSFEITVSTPATAGIVGTGGGLVQLALVETGVYQTVQTACDQEIKYYSLEVGRGYITVHHVLEQSMGWNYGNNPYTLCGTPNSVGSRYYTASLIHDQIQYGEYDSTNLLDTPGSAMSGIGIVNWVLARAGIPHIYHAGSWYSSGAHVSILGAIMEIADATPAKVLTLPPPARTLEQIMKETFFTPLGMVDSFYYLQDADPNRADYLARMSDLYLDGTTVSFGVILPGAAYLVDASYGSTNPRGTVFLDSGLMTTAADQIKFLTMLKSGGLLPDGTRLLPKTLIAEMSRAQNLYFNPDSAYTNSQTGVAATWGYGTAVQSQQSATQSSSALMGTRSIGWLGELGSSWNVDFGHDMFSLYVTNLAGNLFERQRTAYKYNEHLKCVDPQDDSVPSKYYF